MQEEEEEESQDDENIAWKLASDHVQPRDALPATIGTGWKSRPKELAGQQKVSLHGARPGAPTRSSGPGLFTPARGAMRWGAGKNSTRTARTAGQPRPSGRRNESIASGGSGSEVQVLQHEREEIRALKKELDAAKAKVCRVMPLALRTRPCCNSRRAAHRWVDEAVQSSKVWSAV